MKHLLNEHPVIDFDNLSGNFHKWWATNELYEQLLYLNPTTPITNKCWQDSLKNNNHGFQLNKLATYDYVKGLSESIELTRINIGEDKLKNSRNSMLALLYKSNHLNEKYTFRARRGAWSNPFYKQLFWISVTEKSTGNLYVIAQWKYNFDEAAKRFDIEYGSWSVSKSSGNGKAYGYSGDLMYKILDGRMDESTCNYWNSILPIVHPKSRPLDYDLINLFVAVEENNKTLSNEYKW